MCSSFLHQVDKMIRIEGNEFSPSVCLENSLYFCSDGLQIKLIDKGPPPSLIYSSSSGESLNQS